MRARPEGGPRQDEGKGAGVSPKAAEPAQGAFARAGHRLGPPRRSRARLPMRWPACARDHLALSGGSLRRDADSHWTCRVGAETHAGESQQLQSEQASAQTGAAGRSQGEAARAAPPLPLHLCLGERQRRHRSPPRKGAVERCGVRLRGARRVGLGVKDHMRLDRRVQRCCSSGATRRRAVQAALRPSPKAAGWPSPDHKPVALARAGVFASLLVSDHSFASLLDPAGPVRDGPRPCWGVSSTRSAGEHSGLLSPRRSPPRKQVPAGSTRIAGTCEWCFLKTLNRFCLGTPLEGSAI